MTIPHAKAGRTNGDHGGRPDADGGAVFEEQLRADADALAVRGFASNFCAAWLAFWPLIVADYSANLEEAFRLSFPARKPKSAARIVSSVSRTTMALMSAAVRADKSNSQRRRFKCSAWVLESYYCGVELVTDGLPAAESKRRRDNFSRYWRGRWQLLHLFQCVTQVPLFTRSARGWKDNRQCHESASYTDQATDLFLEIMGRARYRRGVSRVARFAGAAREGVENFRRKFGEYAPDYVLPPPPPEPGKSGGPSRPATNTSFIRAKKKLSEGIELLKAMAEAGKLTAAETDEIVLLLAPVVSLARPVESSKECGVTSEEAAGIEHVEGAPPPVEAAYDSSGKFDVPALVPADKNIRRTAAPGRPDVSPSDFLSAFYADPHEEVRLRAFGPKGAPSEERFSAVKITTRRAALAEDERLRGRLRGLNRTRGIYFVVNAGGDNDASITRFNAFFAEMDEGTLAEQHAKFDASPIPPAIRLETLKSVHAYWPAAPGCAAEEWREVQRRLIRFFGGDPKIKNPSRVMRLPGFDHVKYGDGLLSYRPIVVSEFKASRRFTVDDMLEAFPAAPEVRPRTQRSPKSVAELAGDFEAYKRELGARICDHPTARRNGRGKWDCQGVCHNGKGATGLFYAPADNFVWCNADPPCDLDKIARAFGLSRPPNSVAAGACAVEQGTL